MQRILCLILGGGRGTRLYPLTKRRSKPAMPVAGKYRLIDIPISNCLNSDLNKIYVLTQFNSVSLHRHIANTYKFDMFREGFVEILAAQQTLQRENWYQGTADAVRHNIDYIRAENPSHVLILSGDQLYRMDFRDLIVTHEQASADVTIAVLPVASDQVGGLGITGTDDTGRVTGFVEKPKTLDPIRGYARDEKWLRARDVKQNFDRPYLASMGIYLFDTEVLFDLLTRQTTATDFGKEIFPNSIQSHRVQAHVFDGFWEDLGTIRSYHEVSLALASDNPPFTFVSEGGTIFTRMRNLPASRISGAVINQSRVSDGCLIHSGTQIERSIVGVRSIVGKNVTFRESIMIGADRYETDADKEENARLGRPNLGLGAGCVIERAILDKDCRIGDNVRIRGYEDRPDEDGENFCVRDGIVVVPRGSVIPSGSVI